MTTTTNLGLQKPAENDNLGASLAAFNANADKLDAAQPKRTTVSLPASGWDAEAKTQTVSVAGMTESALVITSAAPVSFVAWSDAGVRCSAQSGGALTFACETIPTEDLTGNVVILA